MPMSRPVPAPRIAPAHGIALAPGIAPAPDIAPAHGIAFSPIIAPTFGTLYPFLYSNLFDKTNEFLP